MRYSLILRIDNTAAYELLKPDLQKAERGRSKIELSRQGKGTIVKIEAEDAVALRASIDSVVQLLKVYEKMGGAR
jgi:tRNA threonylcarbamoyladenosine modification (KEOPS) complex  Pcc1 subunit